MAQEESDLSTQVYYNQAWIDENGRWLHSNNVMFYFAQSPFQHRLSANNTVIQQSQGIPHLEERNFFTREKFEAALARHLGISYVVEFDPVIPQNRTLVLGPDGKEEVSSTWIIRKQDRKSFSTHNNRGEDVPSDVKILDYYYILNGVIFQAPLLGSILNFRLTNTLMAVDKMVTQASVLGTFSPSYGHGYFKAGQKSTATTTAGDGQQSKVGTPAPEGSNSMTQDAKIDAHVTEQQSDERILRAALTMTMNFGEQYYDDAPLVGEPGNFRLATAKHPVHNLKVAEAGAGLRSVAASKANTPAPLTPAKAPPSNPGSPVGLSTSSGVDTLKPKPKRKKSTATNVG